jgi:hypothetical protein
MQDEAQPSLRAAPLGIMRLPILLSFSLACLMPVVPSAAQESRLATQAVHCSAILAVFAEAHADDPTLAAKFGKAVGIFDEVYAKERGGDAGAALREAGTRRTALLDSFRATLAEREPYLREDGVVCGAWAEGFLSQGPQWSYVPVYPKVIGAGIRAEYEKLGAAALGRWRK